MATSSAQQAVLHLFGIFTDAGLTPGQALTLTDDLWLRLRKHDGRMKSFCDAMVLGVSEGVGVPGGRPVTAAQLAAGLRDALANSDLPTVHLVLGSAAKAHPEAKPERAGSPRSENDFEALKRRVEGQG